jgi:hypothetical protein
MQRLAYHNEDTTPVFLSMLGVHVHARVHVRVLACVHVHEHGHDEHRHGPEWTLMYPHEHDYVRST